MKLTNVALLAFMTLFSLVQGVHDSFVLLKDAELGKIKKYADDNDRLAIKHKEIEVKDGKLWINKTTECDDFNYIGVNKVDSFTMDGDDISWETHAWHGNWDTGTMFAAR